MVSTCQKCHEGASRRFAGYLSHATHHDPEKYPWLFWTFWGMTTLLAGTFVAGGLHTLLWLPRAFEMRRELKAEEVRDELAAEAMENANTEALNETAQTFASEPEPASAAPASDGEAPSGTAGPTAATAGPTKDEGEK